MVFEVIDGEGEWNDRCNDTGLAAIKECGRHKSLMQRYTLAYKSLREQERQHGMKCPFMFKNEIMGAINHRSVLRQHDRYKAFMDELSPAADLGDFRTSGEIISDLFIWDGEEKLEDDEAEYLYGLFAEETTRFYFHEEITAMPCKGDIPRHAEDSFSAIILKGVRDLYGRNYGLMLNHHDFFHHLYDMDDNGRMSLFRNAWALWYEHIGNHSVDHDRLDIAKKFEYLCSVAWSQRDSRELGMHLGNLERKLNHTVMDHRKIIGNRIFGRFFGSQLVYPL